MTQRHNGPKQVIVKEHPGQSISEAGIYDLDLPDGTRIVALGNTLFPNHDKGAIKMILDHIEAKRPEVVILLGHMVDEHSFRSLDGKEDNFLHRLSDSAEFAEAMKEDSFEARVLNLGRACGDFIKQFAQFGATVYYIPSWVTLGMPNEYSLMEFIKSKKKDHNAWLEKEVEKSRKSKAESAETSDDGDDSTESAEDDVDDVEDFAPSTLPLEIDELFGIAGLENVVTLRYGAGILVNKRTLFLIGAFRRRQPGDSAYQEWVQHGYNIVRSFDGKSASTWWTNTHSTYPHMVITHHQGHEVGALWDWLRQGHLKDDYHYRCPSAGFFSVWHDELFGEVVPVIPGVDGRRSMLIDGTPYTEETPGALIDGGTLKLAGSGESSTGLKNKVPRTTK